MKGNGKKTKMNETKYKNIQGNQGNKSASCLSACAKNDSAFSALKNKNCASGKVS